MQGLLYQMFGTTDGMQILVMMLTRLFIVMAILPVHEYAHARMAKKLGDNTAEEMGRLTLNPFKHLNGLGAAMLLLFGFGFAKPVPVNPARFTNQEKRRGGMALTAFAGPLSNLIMAVIAMFVFAAASALTHQMFCAEGANGMAFYYLDRNFWYYAGMFLAQFAMINISLAVFNMLPIPPLDGSRIFGLLFPEKWMMAIERYSFFIIIALFFILNRVSGVGNALGSLTQGVFMLIYRGIALIFRLFGVDLIL